MGGPREGRPLGWIGSAIRLDLLQIGQQGFRICFDLIYVLSCQGSALRGLVLGAGDVLRPLH